jgi:hypothetical protein
MAALSIAKYPMEHWQRHLITHSSGPYANPHNIDPICITGLDYEAVLCTVKAETITDIPLNLYFKNHSSDGSIGEVSIIHFDDLAPASDPSSGPDLDPIPEAYSSGDEYEVVDLQGGGGYADVLQAFGAPLPLVEHGAPFSAAPAASIVARALANAPPLPIVSGSPILTKPSSVIIKLHLGFFDVFIEGSKGERAFFRLPMRRASADPGCKGIMVANLATAHLVAFKLRYILRADAMSMNKQMNYNVNEQANAPQCKMRANVNTPDHGTKDVKITPMVISCQ